MKKLILLIVLLNCFSAAEAQSWKNFNSYGLQYKNVSTDTTWRLSGAGANGFMYLYSRNRMNQLLAAKQDAISLTTSGTSGAATFDGTTLNIPDYSSETTVQMYRGSDTFTISGTGAGAIATKTITIGTTQIDTNYTVVIAPKKITGAQTTALFPVVMVRNLSTTQFMIYLQDFGTASGVYAFDWYLYPSNYTGSGGGGGSYTLPVASASVLGGVKVGSGLAIDGGGVLSTTGGGGGGGISSVSSANSDISVADGSTAPVLTLNSGFSNNQVVKRTFNGGVAFDSSINTRIYTGSNEEIVYSSNEPINGKNGFHSWLIRGNQKMRLATNGELLIASLATGETPPSQAGTVKMVTTDQYGYLSFDDIPSGGGGSGTVTSFGKVDGFGITSSVANSTTTPVHTIAVDSSQVRTVANSLTKAQTQTALNTKQNTISLTTSGTSGAATFDGTTLNIPNYSLTRTLVDFYSDSANTGATVENIYEYNIAAGTIANNGDKIYFDVAGDFANNSNSKALGVYFGNSNYQIYPSSNPVGGSFRIFGYAIRTSNSTYRIAISFNLSGVDSTTEVMVNGSSSVDFSGTVTPIYIRADGDAAGDITLKSGTYEFKAAAL